jgi:hypothetical protein
MLCMLSNATGFGRSLGNRLVFFSRVEVLPKGGTRIAQCFSFGRTIESRSSPAGTAEYICVVASRPFEETQFSPSSLSSNTSFGPADRCERCNEHNRISTAGLLVTRG